MTAAAETTCRHTCRHTWAMRCTTQLSKVELPASRLHVRRAVLRQGHNHTFWLSGTADSARRPSAPSTNSKPFFWNTFRWSLQAPALQEFKSISGSGSGDRPPSTMSKPFFLEQLWVIPAGTCTCNGANYAALCMYSQLLLALLLELLRQKLKHAGVAWPNNKRHQTKFIWQAR